MFTARQIDRSTILSSTHLGSAAWTDHAGDAPRHACRLIVVCQPALETEIVARLSQAIGERKVAVSRSKLSAESDPSYLRLSLGFESEYSEQSRIADVVRGLCRDKHVRYVRLEPR